ncbi:MAG: hypothetical protein V4732_16480 [Pseudomonadota bacterium]
MANQQMYAIANCTGSDANLTSTVSSSDNCSIPAGVITHTGGSDGDYIRVPDCSGSEWYPEQHILVQAADGSWTVSFWSNDQRDGLLYWSPSDNYYEGNPLPGSNGSSNWYSTLLISNCNGSLQVGWARF